MIVASDGFLAGFSGEWACLNRLGDSHNYQLALTG
jgi:hypothetical protein